MAAILNMNSRALPASLQTEVAKVTNFGEDTDKAFTASQSYMQESRLNLVFQDTNQSNWQTFLLEAIFGDF